MYFWDLHFCSCVVESLLPKADVDPSNIAGLQELMAQAVTFKFMPASLSEAQLNELIQRY